MTKLKILMMMGRVRFLAHSKPVRARTGISLQAGALDDSGSRGDGAGRIGWDA
jgi:hypothetical protein